MWMETVWVNFLKIKKMFTSIQRLFVANTFCVYWKKLVFLEW